MENTSAFMPLKNKLARGPILLILSSSVPFMRVVVIPIVQSIEINFELIIVVVIFVIGSYLTAIDYTKYMHSKAIILQNQIKKRASSIVLDKTMREVFSLDCNEGLLGCVLGTCTGIVGLYTLPFAKEQRVRILQSFLPTDVDAKQVFFTPGGFWNVILPDSLRSSIERTPAFDAQSNRSKEETAITVEQKQKGSKKQRPIVLNDLSWDNTTVVESHETEVETIVLSDEDEVTNDAQLHISSPESNVNAMSNYQNRISSIVEEESNNLSPPDPMEILTQIVRECICKIFDETQHKIDDKILHRVSIAASITLLIQLKTSRTARKMLWTSIHFATTCSLVGVLCSSVGVLKLKESLSKLLFNDEEWSLLNHRSNDRSEQIHSPDKIMFTSRSRFNIMNSMLGNAVHLFGNSESENHEERMKRRKLKGFIAVLVLYLFHRKRRR